MPSYPLTIPAELKPKTVKLTKEHNAARSTSPHSFVSQTYVHSGERWLLELTFAPVPDDAGAVNAVQFYQDLQGLEGSFNFDISPYDEGVSGDSTVAFELMDSNPLAGWMKGEGGNYFFDKLTCQEAL